MSQPVVSPQPSAKPWPVTLVMGLIGSVLTTYVSHRYVEGGVLAAVFVGLIIIDVVKRRRAT